MDPTYSRCCRWRVIDSRAGRDKHGHSHVFWMLPVHESSHFMAERSVHTSQAVEGLFLPSGKWPWKLYKLPSSDHSMASMRVRFCWNLFILMQCCVVRTPSFLTIFTARCVPVKRFLAQRTITKPSSPIFPQPHMSLAVPLFATANIVFCLLVTMQCRR